MDVQQQEGSSDQTRMITTTTTCPTAPLSSQHFQTTTPHFPHHHQQQQYHPQHQQHHHHHHQLQKHQSQSYSHVLASPTVSSTTTMECSSSSSPLGNTPEGLSSSFLGKQLTASTSFSGSIRSIQCGVGVCHSSSKQPLQDSEDSSYDSDCEVSDATSHNDVSRTVSDTLAQEFEEYVTVSSRVQQGGSSVSSSSGCSNVVLASNIVGEAFQFNLEDPNYKSKLEFAKKLGYTETQVQIVLSKLGPNPSQNELLNELILLDDNSGLNEIISSTTETVEAGSPVLPTTSSSCSSASGTRIPGGASPAQTQQQASSNLHHIVIDGSNIAMSHGNNKVFSCRGIKLAVEYFKARGHKHITVIVPSYRKESPKPDDPVSDQHILTELEKEGILAYSPSRTLNKRRLICYDDRYILNVAVAEDGIVVSNDTYRDLVIESLAFKKIVEERLLMYSFVNDRFMPPEDPFGRNGPTLDQLLSKSPVTQLPPPCPYGRKCTYGQKCKYYHSTQAKSVSETLRKQAMKTQSVPIALTSSPAPVCRTRSAIVPMESSLMKDLSSSSTTLGGAISTSNNNNNPHRKLQRQLSINPFQQRGANNLSSTNPPPHHHHHQYHHHHHNQLQHHHSLFPSSSTSRDSYSLNPFPGNPTLSEVWRPADWSLPGAGPSSSSRCSATNAAAAVVGSSSLSQDDCWIKSQPQSLVPPSSSSSSQQSQALGAISSTAPSISSPPTAGGAASIVSNPDRTTIYYHLTALFPEHQVKHVMGLYPDSNDPSFICKQITSIFQP